MKLFAHPKCLTDALAPMMTINYLLGLRAFEYPRGQRRSVFSLIYALFLYGIFFNGWLNMEKIYYSDVRLLKLEYILHNFLSLVTLFSILTKLLLGWWHTQKFKVCHKKIIEIDKTLRQLGSTINYDKIYYVTIGIFIIWITMSIIASTFVYIYLSKRTDTFTSIYLIVTYIYSLVICGTIILEFYLFVICLEMRFELVNQLLRENSTVPSAKEMKLGIFEMRDYVKIMNAEQRKNVLSAKVLYQWRQQVQSRINISVLEKQTSVKLQIQKSHFLSRLQKQSQGELRSQFQGYNAITECQKRIHLLQTIKQVHLELCRVSKILCTILGVQTAWEIGVTIMSLTATLYDLYIRYVTNQHQIKDLTAQTSLTIVLSCFHMLKIFFLCRACKQAANEGNKTIEIIHAIYGCRANNAMQEEIQQFGIQILQSPVSFTAFGLSLDNRILSMTLRSITTYLVIMIQVSNSLESNKTNTDT